MNEARASLLIVEDEELNKLILARRLRKEGFAVIEVANGRQAVEKMQELSRIKLPDLVLMDINMPIMDGIEATRILKLEFQQIPIIAVTAGNLISGEYTEKGFSECCKKPINFRELMAKIDKLLGWK